MSTAYIDEEGPADPLDAPPIPYRMAQDPQRFRYTHPTPPRAALRPLLEAPLETELGEPEAHTATVHRRPPVKNPPPPAIPEGEFNPGVAIAWTVAVGMSGVVFLWHAGAAMLTGP